MAIQVIKGKTKTSYRAIFCKHRQRNTHCFERKIDAIQWLQSQEQLHHFGYKSTLPFSDAANQWLEFHSRTRKSPASHEHDKRLVKEYINFFAGINLDQITPERVESFIAKKLKTGVKAATVNRSLECLRAILNYFIKKQYLLRNPVSILGLLPEPELSYDYLSFDEALSFLTHASQKYQGEKRWIYCLYLLAINGGMRWGEIAGLKWDKVNLQNKSIIVGRSYCKQTRQIRETTKSRKIRYVGINSSVLPELRFLFENKSKITNLVFHTNGNPIDLSSFKRNYFEKDLAQVGIRHIRFHDFRHTFASHFAMKGGSLYDLQKLLGHSEIRVTERYAHLSPDSLMTKTELVAIDGKLADVIQLPERNQIQA